MSEADDLGTLVLGLAERCLHEYREKPFPEDREPIMHYFSLLDNLVETTDTPYYFSRGVPKLKSVAQEQAKYFLTQENNQHSTSITPMSFALGTALGGLATIGLGVLTQNVALAYGGAGGFVAGCTGLAHAANTARRQHRPTLLGRHEHVLDIGDIFWLSAFRDYAPEIRCIVARFKKEYAQEPTV